MFYAALAPAIIDLRQRTSKKACVKLAQKSPAADDPPIAGVRRSPGALDIVGSKFQPATAASPAWLLRF